MLVVNQISNVDQEPISTLYTKKLSVRPHTRSDVVEVMLELLRGLKAA